MNPSQNTTFAVDVPSSPFDTIGEVEGIPLTPFSCNVCKKSYSRVDHLARHYRSHTKERPFPCDTCGKRFARADLLRRHAVNHTNEPAKKRKRPSSPPKNRVTLACLACSVAKVKCAEEKPCRRCLLAGIECEPPKATHGSVAQSSVEVPQLDAENAHEHVTEELPRHSLEQQPTATRGRTEMQPSLSHANMVTETTALPYHTGDMSSVPPAPLGQQNDMDTMASSAWYPQEQSLGDFLAEVMMPIQSPADQFESNANTEGLEQDFLYFGIDNTIDFNDFNFGLFETNNSMSVQPFQQPLLDESTYPPSRGDDSQEPAIDNNASEAFQRSLWRWIPGKLDTGRSEQLNISLPSNTPVETAHSSRPCQERLAQSSRDRVMAMVMRTCEVSAIPHIVSHFPSVDILDCLIQDFLHLDQRRAVSHIHISTYEPNEMRPEMVAMTVASGAVRNGAPAVRKLGFALQEAVRLVLPKMWENDNSLTRDLQLLQSFTMCLDVGLWSGNKRKMEISESHEQPVVTMLRRGGRFKKPKSSPALPMPSDPADVLNSKWRAWVEAESFKRLVFALLVHDAQVSMSFFISPLITSGEISLEMPASQSLWRATSASDWRDALVALGGTSNRRLPDVARCMQDPHEMLDFSDHIDMDFSKQIILSMFWRQIWHSRQLNVTLLQNDSSSPALGGSLAPGGWQQDLVQSIQYFRMTIADETPLSTPAALVYEHLMLNIFVSFEELSLFSGKEGTQEARRAFPLLRQWAKSKDSRQAVWHAGQILREATVFPPGLLRDFYAVALYHAGLALWAYGLLSNERSRAHTQNKSQTDVSMSRRRPSGQRFGQRNEAVFLDGHETVETQKFIALNRGMPALHHADPSSQPDTFGAESGSVMEQDFVPLDNPKAVLETVIHVLRCNHGLTEGRLVSPLVENLIYLMRDLSRAATKIYSR